MTVVICYAITACKPSCLPQDARSFHIISLLLFCMIQGLAVDSGSESVDEGTVTGQYVLTGRECNIVRHCMASFTLQCTLILSCRRSIGHISSNIGCLFIMPSSHRRRGQDKTVLS